MDRRGIENLAERHLHVLTRAQLLDAAATDRWVRHLPDIGSWQHPYPGVYITHSGRPEWLTRVTAPLAYAGEGAAPSHSTASDWWFDTKTIADGVESPLEVWYRRDVERAHGPRAERVEVSDGRARPA